MNDRFIIKTRKEFIKAINKNIDTLETDIKNRNPTNIAERNKELLALVITLLRCTGVDTSDTLASDINELDSIDQRLGLSPKLDYLKKTIDGHVEFKENYTSQGKSISQSVNDLVKDKALAIIKNNNLPRPQAASETASHTTKPLPISSPSISSPQIIVIKDHHHCPTFLDFWMWDNILHSTPSYPTYTPPASSYSSNSNWNSSSSDKGSHSSSSSSSSSSGNSKDNNEHTIWAIIIAFIVATCLVITSFLAAAYTSGKVWNSLKNTFSAYKFLRSPFRLAATAGGMYFGISQGAAIGAALGSVIPGFGTLAGSIVGAIFCGYFAAIGSKYFAREISAQFHPKAINPYNPEKYELTSAQEIQLNRQNSEDPKRVNVFKRAIEAIYFAKKDYKSWFDFEFLQPERWAEKKNLNQLLLDVKNGNQEPYKNRIVNLHGELYYVGPLNQQRQPVASAPAQYMPVQSNYSNTAAYVNSALPQQETSSNNDQKQTPTPTAPPFYVPVVKKSTTNPFVSVPIDTTVGYLSEPSPEQSRPMPKDRFSLPTTRGTG